MLAAHTVGSHHRFREMVQRRCYADVLRCQPTVRAPLAWFATFWKVNMLATKERQTQCQRRTRRLAAPVISTAPPQLHRAPPRGTAVYNVIDIHVNT